MQQKTPKKANLPCLPADFNIVTKLDPSAELQINASIVQYDGRYFCSYRSDFFDGNFDPKNYLTELNYEFLPKSHNRLIAEDGNTAFEDIRLFEFKGKLMAIYTFLPKHADGWVWENNIGIAEIDLERMMLIKQQSLKSIAQNVHEKNYVPYIYLGQLYLISNFSPRLRIIKASGTVGNFTFEEQYSGSTSINWKYGDLRGGTPFLTRPDCLDWQYAFVHSSLFLPNGNFGSRFYMYTICRFDPRNYRLQFIKEPLDFSRDDISNDSGPRWILNSKKNLSIKVVFPMGLLKYKEGLLLSYGKDDCISKTKFYSWDYIDYLFNGPNVTEN